MATASFEPRGGLGSTIAVAASLEAFEAYAVSLHGLLGSLELAAEALQLLLQCAGGCSAGGATAVDQTASAGVVEWCLAGGQLCAGGPAAAAGRVLLLQRALGGAAGLDSALQEALLTAAPAALEEAPQPVAEGLAAAVARALPDATRAAAWLRQLQPGAGPLAASPGDGDAVGGEGEGVEGTDGCCAADGQAGALAYSRVAAALLARHPGGEVLEVAWEAATATMTAPSSSARQVCISRLLPPLVAATDTAEAARRLSTFVAALLGSQNRGGLADALSLTVAFHEPLLGHWRLTSWAGDHDALGQRLISLGLRAGLLKELASLRKQARFLLESAAQVALAAPDAEAQLKAFGVTGAATVAAWRCYWELFDSIEDYSSHLLKAGWEALVGRLTQYFEPLSQACPDPSKLPPSIPGPQWLEVFLSRSLNHGNDSVQKFVLGRLIALDQGAVRLSEGFILEEMLPQFSNSIDLLYPSTDVHQTFEKQTAAFFSGFVAHHPRGKAEAAARLLRAILRVRAVHYTPLRLVLSVLQDADAAGALSAEEALDTMQECFKGIVSRLPVSVRPILAPMIVRVLTQLCREPSAEEVAPPALAENLAEAASVVPDALLPATQAPLATLSVRVLGAGAAGRSAELLESLAAPGADAAEAPPMRAAQLTLGVVRLLWALSSTEGGEPRPFEALVWPAVAPTLKDIHRRPYLPRRAAAVALMGCAYGSALLPDGDGALQGEEEARAEVLAFVDARARASLAPATAAEEAPWVWLHTLALERMWAQGLPGGDAIMAAAVAALEAQRCAPERGEMSPSEVLVSAAAAALLGALAPRAGTLERRAELFLVLWRARICKPAGVSDLRFGIADEVDGLGRWTRNRLEEHEDLHRVDREGPARVLEWRDAISVFLTAKWRALADIARAGGPELLGAIEAVAASKGTAGGAAESQKLAEDLIAELEVLQPSHIAYWSLVARRVALPLFFAPSGAPEDQQREALRLLCQGLSGVIRQGTGDSSTFMPRGCMVEVAAALCDPHLLEAERRLHLRAPGEKEGGRRPLTDAVLGLLALGECAVGISRSLVVPLMAALLRPLPPDAADGEAVAAAELVTSLLLHREAVIGDGALCHAPAAAAGLLDSDSPGGERSLAASCLGADAICRKFGGTPGLPRVLTLCALDGVAARARELSGPMPRVVVAALQEMLRQLREVLALLLNPPGKKVANRPPTPMPMSHQHRTQLRGWQAVLVLGCHAERATAEMLLPELFHHLSVVHVPDVRDYQELLGCVLCSRFEDLAIEPLLVPALRQYDAAVQVSASLLVITSYLFKRWATTGVRPRQAAGLVAAVAPYLGHNSAYVRGMAAYGYYYALQGAAGAGEDSSLLRELHRFLAENKECQKMRNRCKPVFEGFEPEDRTALACLLERSTVLPGPKQEFTEAEQSLHIFSDSDFQPTSTFLGILKDEIAHEMELLWDRSDETQYPSISDNWHALRQEGLRRLAAAAAAQAGGGAPDAAGCEQPGPPTAEGDGAAAGGASGLQRKFCPPAPPVAPGEQSAVARASRKPLVVLASMIDKTPNLAGLCRTSEVFHCEALCLANAKIAKDQTFQSISVTAEKWLPIREVPRAALRSQLLELRRRGYALVGVEQTHTSVPLDQWRFSPQTALLLGAEKEGIDAELLPLLDACVEIPQDGQIRSLNVHVSGSLVIWEYVRQMRQRR